jgi:hypothetical protein
MPEFLEKKLASEADKKGFSGKRKDRYVYGALNNQGMMKGSSITRKGAEAEKKHEAKMGRKG